MRDGLEHVVDLVHAQLVVVSRVDQLEGQPVGGEAARVRQDRVALEEETGLGQVGALGQELVEPFGQVGVVVPKYIRLGNPYELLDHALLADHFEPQPLVRLQEPELLEQVLELGLAEEPHGRVQRAVVVVLVGLHQLLVGLRVQVHVHYNAFAVLRRVAGLARLHSQAPLSQEVVVAGELDEVLQNLRPHVELDHRELGVVNRDSFSHLQGLILFFAVFELFNVFNVFNVFEVFELFGLLLVFNQTERAPPSQPSVSFALQTARSLDIEHLKDHDQVLVVVVAGPDLHGLEGVLVVDPPVLVQVKDLETEVQVPFFADAHEPVHLVHVLVERAVLEVEELEHRVDHQRGVAREQVGLEVLVGDLGLVA